MGFAASGSRRRLPCFLSASFPAVEPQEAAGAGRHRDVVREGPAGVEGALSRPGPEGLRGQRLWRAP